MRRRALAGLWLLLLAAPMASCEAHGPTPAEARAACKQDPAAECCGNGDCAQGLLCDFSLVCALDADREVRCSPPTGDRRCHAACDAARPCLAGQTCQTRSIANGSDTPTSVSICVAMP